VVEELLLVDPVDVGSGGGGEPLSARAGIENIALAISTKNNRAERNVLRSVVVIFAILGKRILSDHGLIIFQIELWQLQIY
jgi:hypothetical protein